MKVPERMPDPAYCTTQSKPVRPPDGKEQRVEWRDARQPFGPPPYTATEIENFDHTRSWPTAFVFFDLETTGIDLDKSEIIQIAAVAVGEFPWLHEFQEFEIKIKPSPAGKIDLEYAAKQFDTNYDKAVWEADGKNAIEGLDLFRRFLKLHARRKKQAKNGSWYPVCRLAGHNITRFDMPILARQFKACSLFLPAEYQGLDTLQGMIWGMDLYKNSVPPHQQRLNLASCCELLKVEGPVRAHDALCDVDATIRVARALGERFGWGKP